MSRQGFVDEAKFPVGKVQNIAGRKRRVGNALVADLQSGGRVPSLEMLIKAVEAILSILTKEGVSDHAIFLATDDAEAVGVFKRAFGCRLTVRDNVQRTTSDAAEVHFRDWDSLSITDAEDVFGGYPAIIKMRCSGARV